METTNFNQTPEALILELFNGENETTYTASQIDILSDYKSLANNRRSVVAKILDLSLVDADLPYATLKYTPISLAEQFSVIELEIREYDTFDDSFVVTDTNILSEVTRRYGIQTNLTEFSIRQDAGVYYLTATDVNRAYAGEVPISMTLSLHTRVDTTELLGFYPRTDLDGIIVTTNVSPYEDGLSESDVKRNTWFRDFTVEIESLVVSNGKLADAEELNERLAIYGIPPIDPDAAVVRREVRPANDENTNFTHVLKTTGLPEAETHYLHFNEEAE